MTRQFTVAGKTITDDSDPFVIAEIGNNHQGRVDLCKHLIYSAKRAGCDAVKLQKRSPRDLFTKALYDTPYENSNSFGKTYGEHREALEFNQKQWCEIVDYAEKEGIFLFSTAFDVQSANFLANLGLEAFKVASGCLSDLALIKHLADFGMPIVISTGGANWLDVDRVYRLMKDTCTPFCFLHCVASYPNRPEEMNLRVIPAMKERYPDIMIGLSDHYHGSLMALSAYGMGAQVFERHFTKDKTWQGPDHALSAEPWEMEMMIHDMRRMKAAWGSAEKRMLDCEKAAIKKMGKGLYAARDLRAGHVLEAADICVKSPAASLLPWEIDTVIGRRIVVDLGIEQPITKEVVG